MDIGFNGQIVRADPRPRVREVRYREQIIHGHWLYWSDCEVNEGPRIDKSETQNRG